MESFGTINRHITSFQDTKEYNFTRKAIREKRVVRYFGIWDDDWTPDNLQQVFAIYEEDNTHTITFTSSLSTILDSILRVTGSLGYSITRQSQDAIIRQLKISRNSYFQGAFQDQGWGF